jgi:hypothetical protein
MRVYVISVIYLLFFQVLLGSGCTNIDVPVHNGDEPSEPLIICEKTTILDTEPVVLTVENASGLVTWRCEPHFDNCFQPETGSSVLFLPPDIDGKMQVTVIAEDENGTTALITMILIDEGDPPVPGDIILTEIAWAGTLTSSYDEYIELQNCTDRPFYLNNWSVENAGGSGMPLGFYGRIEPGENFLIANYAEESERTAIDAAIHYSTSSLSLPNSSFGPFVLLNSAGVVFDTVGDGGDYVLGLNSEQERASISRYTWSTDTQWVFDSWYTESVCINLNDGTFGTPGEMNSDIPLQSGPSEDDAAAIITEYAVDPTDEIGEDWIEILITKGGTLKRFTATDLDGEDAPITGDLDLETCAGEYYLIIWHDYPDDYDFEADGYIIENNRIYIPDNPPTGTKDQIVLLCAGFFTDGLCYYTEGNDHFDNDERQMRGYGWTGDPVLGKYAARKEDGMGSYLTGLNCEVWDTAAIPSPGLPNQ